MEFITFSIILIIVLIVLIIYACNELIIKKSKRKVFNSFTDIPFNKVGLVLGTAKYLAFGNVNPFYRNRIRAAIELYRNKKIKYIIVSGDSNKNNYNEPEQMQADLIKEGVEPSHIFMDNAGIRTYNSMLRLKKIFDQKEATIISQKFHNQRAIFIGIKMGLHVIGYNALDVKGKAGYNVLIREKFARVKAILDILVEIKPNLTAKKVSIPK